MCRQSIFKPVSSLLLKYFVLKAKKWNRIGKDTIGYHELDINVIITKKKSPVLDELMKELNNQNSPFRVS